MFGSKSKEEYNYPYKTFTKPIGSCYFAWEITNWVSKIGQFTESVVKL